MKSRPERKIKTGASSPMSEFVVELYVARTDTGTVERGAARARLAADELARQGTAVRYLNSIFVPEDETCFFLYEGESAEAVRDAARLAGLSFEHVAEAVEG
jgi:Protein of unknown function (DUF4242)